MPSIGQVGVKTPVVKSAPIVATRVMPAPTPFMEGWVPLQPNLEGSPDNRYSDYRTHQQDTKDTHGWARPFGGWMGWQKTNGVGRLTDPSANPLGYVLQTYQVEDASDYPYWTPHVRQNPPQYTRYGGAAQPAPSQVQVNQWREDMYSGVPSVSGPDEGTGSVWPALLKKFKGTIAVGTLNG